jgi:mobilization protein NikA
MGTKEVMFRIRVTAEELAAWKRAAGAAGLTVSAWVRNRLSGGPMPAVERSPVRSARPVTVPSVPVTPPMVQEDVCRRCGHNRSSHWIKGCLAGCLCSEMRYRG